MAGYRPLAAKGSDQGLLPEDLNHDRDQPLRPPESVGQIAYQSRRRKLQAAQLQLHLARPRAAPAHWAAGRAGLV